MKICPIAIAVGCRRCPIFKVCPVKSLIGDQAPASATQPTRVASPAPRKPAKPAARKSAAAKRPAGAKAAPRRKSR